LVSPNRQKQTFFEVFNLINWLQQASNLQKIQVGQSKTISFKTINAILKLTSARYAFDSTRLTTKLGMGGSLELWNVLTPFGRGIIDPDFYLFDLHIFLFGFSQARELFKYSASDFLENLMRGIVEGSFPYMFAPYETGTSPAVITAGSGVQNTTFVNFVSTSGLKGG
jgi:hypothetical protein